ncbi:MAG: GNAT family N-acetyltransferase [Cyanobacteria bacterium NC_groundwater_1444_Ag_S-0.65um_54_12]|nr:GNAT family N-acetyltransferase [Cyanobacteria bacterium NC_groundwater_1444_Ag_S-0.65um_54_12]
MDRPEALALLERSSVMHVASTTGDGKPVLRAVHGVVVDGAVAFHGARAGEKMAALGRAAVISAQEAVAYLPSYFVDPQRACAATTFYRSVQVHGRLELVDDPQAKARVLHALLAKHQPAGGHLAIKEDHPLYRNAVEGILIARVSLDQIAGKAKLGQNRQPEELVKILELLWRRGHHGDPRAIDLVRQANPAVPTPPFLEAPEGIRLLCALSTDQSAAALSLLEGTYWNAGIPDAVAARALLSSAAWVGAQDSSGTLVAMARAISDTAMSAWIYDVVVRSDWRGKGVGKAIMRLLLDHPAVRNARKVRLSTRDAPGFYERFGFRDIRSDAPPSTSKEMMMMLATPEPPLEWRVTDLLGNR